MTRTPPSIVSPSRCVNQSVQQVMVVARYVPCAVCSRVQITVHTGIPTERIPVIGVGYGSGRSVSGLGISFRSHATQPIVSEGSCLLVGSRGLRILRHCQQM